MAAALLAEAPWTRSNTSVCLAFADPAIAGLSEDEQRAWRRFAARKGIGDLFYASVKRAYFRSEAANNRRG